MMEWRAFLKTFTCRISNLALLLSFLAALPINLSTLGKICHCCFSSHSTRTSWESIYHKVDRRHIVRAARVTHPSATIRPNLSWLSWLFFFRPKFKIIMWCWKHIRTPISWNHKGTISRWFLWQTIWANIWPRWPKGYLGAKTFVFLAKKRNFDGMDLLGTSSLGRHQDYGPKYLAVFLPKSLCRRSNDIPLTC